MCATNACTMTSQVLGKELQIAKGAWSVEKHTGSTWRKMASGMLGCFRISGDYRPPTEPRSYCFRLYDSITHFSVAPYWGSVA